jgi:EmrB/QacA subfamily drug resistance transporter
MSSQASTLGRSSVSIVVRPRVVLATCCLSLFLVMMDVTIVNVALPSIGAALGAATDGLQWVIDGYTLVIASFLMLAGSSADRVGRRRTFQIGLAVFGAGSLACSLAPDLHALVACRMLQALGGAMLNPVAISIITNTFTDPRERARAIGVWGAVVGIAMAIGPLLGGVLVQRVEWSAIFWINVPICIAAIVLTQRFVPESRAERPRRFDPIGQLLMVILLASVTGSLIEAPRLGWSSPAIVAGLLVTVGAVAAFVRYERGRAEPLVDVRLLGSASMAGAALTAVLAFTAFSATLFIAALYLQQALHLQPASAGACMLPIAGAMFVCAPLSGRLVAVGRTRHALLVSAILMTSSGALLVNLDVTTPILHTVVALALLGAGLGFVNTPITNSAVSGLPRAQAGLAAGIASTSRQVGATLGVALAGTLTGGIAGAHPSFSSATHAVWWLVLACGVGIAALAFLTKELAGAKPR